MFNFLRREPQTANPTDFYNVARQHPGKLVILPTASSFTSAMWM